MPSRRLAIVSALLAAAAGFAQEKPAPLPKGATARLGTPRDGVPAYTEWVLPLPPDFKTFALREVHTVVVRDAATGRVVSRYEVGDRTSQPVVPAVSGDGTRMALTDFREFFVLDVATGRTLLRHPGGGRITHGSVCLSRDGRRLAYGSWAENKDAPAGGMLVQVWDVDANKVLARAPVPEFLSAAAQLSADGKRLAAWPRYSPSPPAPEPKDGEIPPPRVAGQRNPQPCVLRVWDVDSGKLLCQVTTPDPYPTVAFSPAGDAIAAADEDGRVSWWDVDTNTRRGAVPLDKKQKPTPAFSADGKTLGVLGRDGAVRRWAVADGRELDPVALPPAPSYVVSSGFDFADPAKPRAWRFNGSIVDVSEPGGTPTAGNTSPVGSIGFLKGGKEVVTISASGLMRWDAATGKPLAGPLGPPPDHDGHARFHLVRISEDGTRGVGVTPLVHVQGKPKPGRVLTFDPLTGRETATLPVTLAALEQLRAPSTTDLKRWVLFRTGMAGPSIAVAQCEVWDATTGTLVAKHTLPLGSQFDHQAGASVSPDGTQLVTAVGGRRLLSPGGVPIPRGTDFTLWDLKTGQAIGRVETDHPTRGVRLAAANGSGAVYFDDRLRAINFAAGSVTEPAGVPGGAVTFGPRFNATGTRFAVAQQPEPGKSELRVYDWPGCSLRNSFDLPNDALTLVTFSPDGRTLATASRDNTVLLWDLTARLGK